MKMVLFVSRWIWFGLNVKIFNDHMIFLVVFSLIVVSLEFEYLLLGSMNESAKFENSVWKQPNITNEFTQWRFDSSFVLIFFGWK